MLQKPICFHWLLLIISQCWQNSSFAQQSSTEPDGATNTLLAMGVIQCRLSLDSYNLHLWKEEVLQAFRLKIGSQIMFSLPPPHQPFIRSATTNTVPSLLGPGGGGLCSHPTTPIPRTLEVSVCFCSLYFCLRNGDPSTAAPCHTSLFWGWGRAGFRFLYLAAVTSWAAISFPLGRQLRYIEVYFKTPLFKAPASGEQSTQTEKERAVAAI